MYHTQSTLVDIYNAEQVFWLWPDHSPQTKNLHRKKVRGVMRVNDAPPFPVCTFKREQQGGITVQTHLERAARERLFDLRSAAAAAMVCGDTCSVTKQLQHWQGSLSRTPNCKGALDWGCRESRTSHSSWLPLLPSWDSIVGYAQCFAVQLTFPCVARSRRFTTLEYKSYFLTEFSSWAECFKIWFWITND